MKRLLIVALSAFMGAPVLAGTDLYVSRGRSPDPTAKILAEIRESERRRIPIEVAVTTRQAYKGAGIPVTITITNLFDNPLLLNSRMLVNHRLLPGELSFTVIGPDGRKCEFQRLVAALELTDADFVLLARGMSIQRTIDLADFFKMSRRGTYKVQAFYRNETDHLINGRKAWMGIAYSDLTEFNIR